MHLACLPQLYAGAFILRSCRTLWEFPPAAGDIDIGTRSPKTGVPFKAPSFQAFQATCVSTVLQDVALNEISCRSVNPTTIPSVYLALTEWYYTPRKHVDPIAAAERCSLARAFDLRVSLSCGAFLVFVKDLGARLLPHVRLHACVASRVRALRSPCMCEPRPAIGPSLHCTILAFGQKAAHEQRDCF